MSIDAKREDFRKYLEKEGILETLTKSLVALYEAPDKPADPLCFLRNNFAGQNIEELQETVKKLTAEKEKLLVDVETLSKENSELKDKLAAAEKTAQVRMPLIFIEYLGPAMFAQSPTFYFLYK